MFYEFSQEQINSIKAKLYPQEQISGEFLKTVIVNDYGSDNADNSFRIIYNFKDGRETDADGKQVFKIFNNEFAKKYIKLKLFEITNNNMLDEATRAAADISLLEGVISKYGALSRNLVPSLDFIGDKTNLSAHLTSNVYGLQTNIIDNSINLLFDVSFLLAKPKIEYFTLGAIFYIDKNAYIADQQVEQKFIDEKILVDKLLTYKLYEGNKIVNDAPVQDLRLVKSIFKENKYLDDILNIISSPNSFNKVYKINQYTENEKLSLIPINSKNYILTANLGKESFIKNIKPQTKPKNIFSNVFYSRNFSNKELGILFSINFEQALKENTAFKNLITRSEIKEEFFKKCKISNIKVLRRQVKKDAKGYFSPRLDTSKTIISSGEKKENNKISFINNDEASLTEINLNTGSSARLRTFTITDKRIFSNEKGFYQYGVEFEISNTINQFLLNYADSLMPQIANLKDYLEETNKIAKVVGDDVNGYSLRGSYDAQKNAFTPTFINSYKIPRGKELPSFSKIIQNAITHFVTTIKMFGLMKDSESQITNTLLTMLLPEYTRAETIIYFIKIYERLINQIRKLVKENYNTSFTIKKWFTNDYVSTNEEINLGYRFIEFDSYQGLGTLTSNAYNSLLNHNLSHYSNNQNVNTTQIAENDFAYLAPMEIYSLNKSLQLFKLNENPKAIADLDFTDLEIDIKNINYFGTSIKDKNIKTLNMGKFSNKIDVSISSTRMLERVGPLKEIIELGDVQVQQNLPIQKNTNIDSTDLSLALSKQFDAQKNSYFKFINKPAPKVSLDEYYANSKKVKIDISKVPNSAVKKDFLTNDDTDINLENVEMPIYVRLLLQDKNPILKSNEEYKKSLKLNSKFQFLFNTLHVVEILDYADFSLQNSLQEKWSLLTRTKIESLPAESLHLCRIRNYKNTRLGIEGMQEIKLPVYEQYFLFTRSGILNIQNIIATKDLENIQAKLNFNITTKVSSIYNKLNPQPVNIVPAGQLQQSEPPKNPFAPSITNAGKRRP